MEGRGHKKHPRVRKRLARLYDNETRAELPLDLPYLERREFRHRKERSEVRKKLWSENPDGEPVKYAECSDEHDEAGRIASVIKDGIRKDSFASYKDYAVFYRTNAQSRVLEERLMTESIPYAVVGGMKFYERSEVKDAISYLRVLINPKDSLSLRRIINTLRGA